MTSNDELMEEIAFAARTGDIAKVEEMLSTMSALHDRYRAAIQRGRMRANRKKEPPLEPVKPDIVTIHDLPSRDGIVIDNSGFVAKWRPAA